LEKDLRIKITVDKNTGSLKVINSEFDDLDFKVNKTDKSFGTLKGSIAGLATAAVGIYAVEKALESVMKSGFSFNKELEEAKAGLISLSVAVQDKSIPVLDRYNAANIEATSTLKELQRINAQTPHSLNETNKIYKAMYVSMKNAGASTSDMIELTRSLSIASGAAGIEFNSLLAGVDGLATGTVLANSDLGRFLSSLGLTNEKLKESDDVVKLLNNTLKDFKAADTMGVALSNLGNSWDVLTGKMTEDSFDGAKVGLNTLSDLLNKMSDEDITHAREMINGFSIGAINAVYGISVGVVELINAFDSLGARIAGMAFRIENGIFLSDEESNALESMYAQTHKNMKVRDEFIENLKKSKEAIESTINSNENVTESQREWNEALAEFNKYDPDFDDQIGKTKELSSEQKKAISQQINLNDKLYKQYIDITGTDYDKWALSVSDTIAELGKSTELTTKQFVKLGNELMKTDPLSEAFKNIDMDVDSDWIKQLIEWEKEEQEEKQALLDLEKEYSDFLTSRYKDTLDMQLELAESGMDWANSLDGVAGAINDIAKASKKYFVTNIKEKKKENKVYEDYGKQFISLNKAKEDGLITQQELEKKTYELSINQDKEIHATKISGLESEIGVYGEVAGAMSSMYDEGSRGAEAFKMVQAGLAIVQGAVAIVNQGTGDPYSAIPRMIAMAATVAGVLGSAGISGGGGGDVSAPSVSDAKEEEINSYYDVFLGKLDRQIALLESIDRNGTADKLNAVKNTAEFQKEFELAGLSVRSLIEDKMDDISDDSGVDVTSYYNTNYTEHGIVDPLDFFSHETAPNLFDGFFGTDDEAQKFNDWWEQVYGLTDQEYKEMQNDFQDSINEYATNTIDSITSLLDTSDDLKDTYDELTDSTEYADKQYREYVDQLNAINAGDDIASYLQEQIEIIDSSLTGLLNDDNISLLLSQDPADMKAQVELIDELAEVTGQTFEDGAEDVLNYLDAIEAVSEAMITSNENIKTFEDSFKSDQELLADKAKKLGVSYATSSTGLDALFESLKGGIDGLNDEELDFLEANKSYVDDLIDAQNDLNDAYENSLDAIRAMIDELTYVPMSYSGISSTFSSITADISSLSAASSSYNDVDNVFDEIDRFYSEGSSAISSYYKDMESAAKASLTASKGELKDTIAKVNAEKSILDSFESFANDLKMQQLVGSSNIGSLYAGMNSNLSLTNSSLLSGDTDSAKEYSTSAITYANNYLDAYGNISTSQADMNFQTGLVANKFDSIDGTGDVATLDDLNSQLDTLNNTVIDYSTQEQAAIDNLKSQTLQLLRSLEDVTVDMQKSQIYTDTSIGNETIGLLGDLGIVTEDGAIETAASVNDLNTASTLMLGSIDTTSKSIASSFEEFKATDIILDMSIDSKLSALITQIAGLTSEVSAMRSQTVSVATQIERNTRESRVA